MTTTAPPAALGAERRLAGAAAVHPAGAQRAGAERKRLGVDHAHAGGL